MNRRLALAVVSLALLAGAGWWRYGVGVESRPTFTGYVVSHNLYLSASRSGTVSQVFVRRGQSVQAGDRLFALDPTQLTAQVDEQRALMERLVASERLEQAASLRAEALLAQANTEKDRAAADKQRLLNTYATRKGAVSRSDLDHSLAAAESAGQVWEAARHEVSMAAQRVTMAGAERVQAEARLRGLESQLRDMAPLCPADGVVDDVLYQPGEWVMANVPVMGIIPREEVRVRFFVPQDVVADMGPGTEVTVTCDGCPSGLRATVDFVAERPEYTPPVIYSLVNRERLVFLVEAAPAEPDRLRVGQPLDVEVVRVMR